MDAPAGGGASGDADDSTLFRVASTRGVEGDLVQFARAYPGQLLGLAIEEVDRYLAAREAADTSDTAGAKASCFVTYRTTVFHSAYPPAEVGVRATAELRTIAEALDAITRGDLARAGDLLTQRFKSVELEATGSSSTLARQHELIPPSRVGLAREGERTLAAKSEVLRARLEEIARKKTPGQGVESAGAPPRAAGVIRPVKDADTAPGVRAGAKAGRGPEPGHAAAGATGNGALPGAGRTKRQLKFAEWKQKLAALKRAERERKRVQAPGNRASGAPTANLGHRPEGATGTRQDAGAGAVRGAEPARNVFLARGPPHPQRPPAAAPATTAREAGPAPWRRGQGLREAGRGGGYLRQKGFRARGRGRR